MLLLLCARPSLVERRIEMPRCYLKPVENGLKNRVLAKRRIEMPRCYLKPVENGLKNRVLAF
jgi:hypothetical protein